MTRNIHEMNNSLSILYVEDDQQNQKLVQSIISERTGHKLDMVESGVDGLKIAAVNKPDLILLDINLPDISGYDFMKTLKSNNITESIPVIAITANADKANMSLIQEEDFFAHIIKPFDVNDFVDLVNSTAQ